MSSAAGTALRAESATREKRHRPSDRRFGLGDLDLAAVRTWILAGGLVLYLAADGGGYDPVVYSQVGIVVWWLVLLGAALGLFPRTRLTRAAWTALALFGAFVAWTALSALWSLSTERTLQDTALVAGYLGILALGVVTHRERRVAVRHTVQALAAVIVFVAVLALALRLIPGLFPVGRQTSQLLPSASGRLSWPLNYWNALAALMALGLPLVLATATSAETLAGQAVAAAGLPLIALCAYLTASRGGAIAIAVAVLAFFAFTSERVPKLATALVAAAASAALIASAVSRPAIDKGLHNAAARHQGASLLVLVVVVCAAVALAQVGIALLLRRLRRSRGLAVPRRPAVALLAAGVVAVLVAAVALNAPSRLSHVWHDFKSPHGAGGEDLLARLDSASGNGRYDLWRVAVHYAENHLFHGSGAGTYQLIWLPRAPSGRYVVNAHSLYLETLAELGIVGLALLAAFLALCLGRAIVYVVRAGQSSRVYAAGLAAALITFCVSAAYDWIWQVPVLPAAFLLLSAAILAPRTKQVRGRGATATAPRASRGRERAAAIRSRRGRRRSWAIRGGLVLAAAACLVAIAVPLATTSAVDSSQAAASAGDSSAALAAARTAVGIQPGSASAQLQLALVLELRHQLHRALAAARDATRDEPANWSTWLVLSRLEAEAGHPSAALSAYRRARSLNPKSLLFARHHVRAPAHLRR